eukprot:m.122448 g.122448  ORF g.122448 m.122448 type:complete len:1223 (+) comp13732_c0_seq2:192-3860(+)
MSLNTIGFVPKQHVQTLVHQVQVQQQEMHHIVSSLKTSLETASRDRDMAKEELRLASVQLNELKAEVTQNSTNQNDFALLREPIGIIASSLGSDDKQLSQQLQADMDQQLLSPDSLFAIYRYIRRLQNKLSDQSQNHGQLDAIGDAGHCTNCSSLAEELNELHHELEVTREELRMERSNQQKHPSNDATVVAAMAADIAQLRQTLQTVSDMHTATEQEKTMLVSHITCLEDTSESLRLSLATATTHVSTLEDNYQALLTQYEQLVDTKDITPMMAQTIRELHQTRLSHERQLAQLQLELNTQRPRRRSRASPSGQDDTSDIPRVQSLSHVQSKLSAVRINFHELDKHFKQLQTLALTAQDTETLKQQLAQFTVHFARFESIIGTPASHVAQALAALDGEVSADSDNGPQQTYVHENKRLKERVAALEHERAVLEAHLTQHEQEAQRWQQQAVELVSSTKSSSPNQRRKSEASAIKYKVELERQTARLKEDLDEAISYATQLFQDNQRLSTMVARLQHNPQSAPQTPTQPRARSPASSQASPARVDSVSPPSTPSLMTVPDTTARLHEKLATLQSQLDTNTHERFTLEEKLAASMQQQEAIRDQLGERIDELKTLKADLTSSQVEAERLSEEVERLKDQLIDSGNKHALAEQRSKRAVEESNALSHELKRVQALHDSNAAQQAQTLVQVQAELQQVQTALDTKTQEVDRLSTQVQRLTAAANLAEEKLNEHKAMAQDLADAKETIKMLNAKQKTLMQKLSAQANEQEQLEAKAEEQYTSLLAEHRSFVAQHEQQVDQLSLERSQLEAQRDELLRNVEDLDTVVAERDVEVSGLKKQLHDISHSRADESLVADISRDDVSSHHRAQSQPDLTNSSAAPDSGSNGRPSPGSPLRQMHRSYDQELDTDLWLEAQRVMKPLLRSIKDIANNQEAIQRLKEQDSFRRGLVILQRLLQQLALLQTGGQADLATSSTPIKGGESPNGTTTPEGMSPISAPASAARAVAPPPFDLDDTSALTVDETQLHASLATLLDDLGLMARGFSTCRFSRSMFRPPRLPRTASTPASPMRKAPKAIAPPGASDDESGGKSTEEWVAKVRELSIQLHESSLFWLENMRSMAETLEAQKALTTSAFKSSAAAVKHLVKQLFDALHQAVTLCHAVSSARSGGSSALGSDAIKPLAVALEAVQEALNRPVPATKATTDAKATGMLTPDVSIITDSDTLDATQ